VERKLPEALLLVEGFVPSVVHGILRSKMGSYQVVTAPWQGHDVILAWSLGIATSGGTRMDSLLECSVLGARGLLTLRPIVVGA
jgi:hypothetical protein